MTSGSMFITLGMIVVFFTAVVVVLYMTNRQQGGFEDYAVGGRSYGSWFIAFSYTNSWWPGSTYTAFFGLTVASGVLGMYALAYSLLGVTAMYLIANRAWRWGKKFDLKTQPDLMGMRYGSNAVKVIASVIGVISLFPWIVLGMQALATLFRFATFERWSVTWCLIAGLVLIAIRQIWTVRMGMRGLIMTDVFQGVVAYVVAAGLCLVLLLGNGAPIGAIAHLPAELLKLPGDGGSYGPLYVFSLVMTGVIGSLCWPTSFQRIYTASGVRSVKLGTVQTILLSGGFYALLTLVGLAVAGVAGLAKQSSGAWFIFLQNYGGDWMLGLAIVIVLAASMGHIDGGVQVAGTQIANDIVHVMKPRSDKQLTQIAKSSIGIYMILAAIVAYATFNIARLQLLAQMSYQGIIQLAVPLFLGIFWKGGNKQGAIAGMVVGFSIAAVTTTIYPDDIRALGSLTGGVLALVVNFIVFMVCHFVFKQSPAERERVEAMFAAADVAKPRPASAPTVSAPEPAAN